MNGLPERQGAASLKKASARCKAHPRSLSPPTTPGQAGKKLATLRVCFLTQVKITYERSFRAARSGAPHSARLRQQTRAAARASAALQRHATGKKQVHGTRIVDVLQPAQACGEADGFYTRQPGILLSVLTADCLPVLFSRSDGAPLPRFMPAGADCWTAFWNRWQHAFAGMATPPMGGLYRPCRRPVLLRSR